MRKSSCQCRTLQIGLVTRRLIAVGIAFHQLLGIWHLQQVNGRIICTVPFLLLLHAVFQRRHMDLHLSDQSLTVRSGEVFRLTIVVHGLQEGPSFATVIAVLPVYVLEETPQPWRYLRLMLHIRNTHTALKDRLAAPTVSRSSKASKATWHTLRSTMACIENPSTSLLLSIFINAMSQGIYQDS